MTESRVCVECGTSRAADQPACPVCSTPLDSRVHEGTTQAAPQPAPARAFAGRYTLLQELGRGGFGVVYRARDERLAREVALKVLGEKIGSDTADRKRFEREALILASLDHPNIVTIFDAGIEGSSPWFAMKLLRGGSLADAMRREPLRPALALHVLSQVASALAHAHAKGVLHRDIKPSNILSDEEGRAYLADFGVSSAGFLPRMTLQGNVVGTLRYLSPEALSGETAAAGDIYSLGAVLYEVLFGERCFEYAETPSLIKAICEETPSRLLRPPSAVHPELLKFLQRLLAKKPADRPQSAGAVAEEAARIRSMFESTSNADTVIAARVEAPPGDESDPTDVLERLENEAAQITSIAGRDSDATDTLLVHLGRFVRESVLLADLLLKGRIDDGVRLALALSVMHMARQVERQLHRAEIRSEGTSPFAAQLFRMQKIVIVPLSALLKELQRKEEHAVTAGDFFQFDANEAAEAKTIDPASIDKLRSPEDLTRHEGVLEIAALDLDAFATALRGERARDELLDILWSYADVILLEARGRSRALFDAGCSLPADTDLRLRWVQLYALFRPISGNPDVLRKAIAQRPVAQRKVFGRCLLIHPDESWRAFALELLEPHDVWEVVSHPSTSVPRLIDIWRAMHDRGWEEFAKIFFACVRDGLMVAGPPERIISVIELLKEFYEVDSFHEDIFFRMLVELDEWARAEARRHHLLVDFDSAYVDRLQNFLAGGVRKEKPIEEWRLVPLPIQRKLARQGHFVRHFACHPLEVIALECMPHVLALGNGASFAAMPGINARLLAELAKDKRLWMTDEARFALVANPKCPPPVVLKYISFLRKDYLKKLADSRDCSALARNTADRMLARKV